MFEQRDFTEVRARSPGRNKSVSLNDFDFAREEHEELAALCSFFGECCASRAFNRS
jgi:hypothetical protein